jgi:hypothetical protein
LRASWRKRSETADRNRLGSRRRAARRRSRSSLRSRRKRLAHAPASGIPRRGPTSQAKPAAKAAAAASRVDAVQKPGGAAGAGAAGAATSAGDPIRRAGMVASRIRRAPVSNHGIVRAWSTIGSGAPRRTSHW